MKFLVAALVFVLTLSLTIKTIANTNHNDEKCGTEKSAAACTEPKAQGHQVSHSAHENLPVKMNSLYPEKQQNTSMTARPSVPDLELPAFLAQVSAGTVKLTWTASKGATDYHVQIATDPNFKWLVVNENFVKTNSFEFSKAEGGKRYFWRVAGFKADNNPSYTKSNFVSSVFNVK